MSERRGSFFNLTKLKKYWETALAIDLRNWQHRRKSGELRRPRNSVFPSCCKWQGWKISKKALAIKKALEREKLLTEAWELWGAICNSQGKRIIRESTYYNERNWPQRPDRILNFPIVKTGVAQGHHYRYPPVGNAPLMLAEQNITGHTRHYLVC